MIDEVFNVKLIDNLAMKISYHENYMNYNALFIIPFLKLDYKPHLIYVEENNYPDYGPPPDKLFGVHLNRLGSKHLKKLTNSAEYHFYELLEKRWFSSVDKIERRLNPFYNRVISEEQESIERYLNTFCEFILEPSITKKVPINVHFDKHTNCFVFNIPFLEYSPTIHIGTVFFNWDTTKAFIYEITTSLSNCIPSKNKSFFYNKS